MAVQTTTIRLPSDLYKRLKKLSDKLNKTMSTIIADALREHIPAVEKRLREDEDEESRNEREARERRRRAIRVESSTPAAPAPTKEESEEEEDETEEESVASVEDQEDVLYLQHAKKIVAARSLDAAERRLVAQTAINAICTAHPLTSDPIDVEKKLFGVVASLSSKASPEPKKETSFLDRFLRYVPTNTDDKETE